MKRLIDGNALASLFRNRRAMDGNPTVQDAFETAMWDAAQAEEITLNALRDEVYQDALEHGLWRPEANTMTGAQLIRGEAKELFYEGGCTNQPSHEYETELADVFIMCLSVAGKFGIDIDKVVKRKMEINKHRPWKHEGEKHEG